MTTRDFKPEIADLGWDFIPDRQGAVDVGRGGFEIAQGEA